MYPVLFEIGDFSVHTYGALGAFGFLLVCLIAIVRARALGVAPERTADLIFWTAVLSLIASRLQYVAQNPSHFDTWWQIVNLRTGGLVFYGALIAGVPIGSLLMWRYRMPFYAMWDVFATAMPLAHGITRIGCFAAGCCWGTASALPWAVSFDHPLAVAPHGVGLHPTQLYEAAWLFGIAAFVNWFYPRKRFDGQIMLLYLWLYAGGRAVLELFRGDATRGWFLPGLFGETLSFSQGVSAVVAVGALGVFLVGARRAAAKLAAGGEVRGPVAPDEG